jgi:hypothetical protein
MCLDGQLYFIRNLHLQDFGFPRVRQPSTKIQCVKRFKWKKINYKTLLPKHQHIVAYLVAKTNNFKAQQFMMHAAAHGKEFDTRYTKTEFTRQIRQESGSRSRLSLADRQADKEVQRVIVCHVKKKLENKINKKPCKQFRKQNLPQTPQVQPTPSKQKGLAAGSANESQDSMLSDEAEQAESDAEESLMRRSQDDPAQSHGVSGGE